MKTYINSSLEMSSMELANNRSHEVSPLVRDFHHGRMLPEETTYRPSAVPGLRIKHVRYYAYTHICYPRCRWWRCRKECIEVTLWSYTKYDYCEVENRPECSGCTKYDCSCGVAG